MKKMFGILCSCTAIMSYLAISPVIADIANAFPGANVSAVQMIITLPSLMSLIFSLLAGRLAKRFYKKTLIIISLCAILIGGILPVFFHESLVFLLICSGIIGVGVGGFVRGIFIGGNEKKICDKQGIIGCFQAMRQAVPAWWLHRNLRQRL